MNRLQKIYEGWKNRLITDEELEKHIAPIREKRISICEKCPFHSSNAHNKTVLSRIRKDRHCTKCGCNIAAKASRMASSCPDTPPRWEAEINDNT